MDVGHIADRCFGTDDYSVKELTYLVGLLCLEVKKLQEKADKLIPGKNELALFGRDD